MEEQYVGMTTYKINDVTYMDNHMPIQLVWEDLWLDGEPTVVRKNWKDMEVGFAAYAAEIDNQSVMQKNYERWQDSLVINIRK